MNLRASVSIVVLVGFVGAMVAACGSDTPSPDATSEESPSIATTPDQRSSAERLLDSASPLHAHLGGDGSSVLCDSDSAAATDTGHGIRVTVAFRGPANLQAEVLAKDGKSQDLTYTVGSQEGGHIFNFPGFKLSQLQTLDVNATNASGSGTCWVVDNMA